MRKKPLKILIILLIVLGLLASLYCVAVFSDIPFVAKWRNLYIETAMSTMTHQWLATKFIPASVIEEVMAQRQESLSAQQDLQSSWADSTEAPQQTVIDGEDGFLAVFDELDRASLDAYLDAHPEALADGWNSLLIDEAGLDADGTTIETTAGDQVLALDAQNGILILKVTGSGYVGRLAVVKDPAAVRLAVSDKLGTTGEYVSQIAEAENAVLAINASGFYDPDGTGNGGQADGLIISDGVMVASTPNDGYLMVGFSPDNLLYIGFGLDASTFRDAVQFYPAVVIDGEDVASDSNWYGINPRTCLGQAADGDVLMLIVDGRQVGYSVGCTVADCAQIMLRYGAVQACNLDGGTSSVMVYRGREISKPSNGWAAGRAVPDAFVVSYAEDLQK